MNRFRISIPIVVLALAAIVAVIVVVAAGGGATKRAQAAIPAGSALTIRHSALGGILVDANGRTLYLFAADRHDLSTLSAAGRAVWPPFTSDVTPTATGGVGSSQIGTIAGLNGARQVTYSGHPLYYYVGDHHPGQAEGQGLNEFGGRWYGLSTQGTAITSAPKSSGATPSSGGSSRYSY